MKAFALFAALMTVATFAQAETAVYQGEINSKPATLQIELSTPAQVTKKVTDPVYDPEFGHNVEVATTYHAVVGTMSLTLGATTATQTLFAVGSDYATGVKFTLDAPVAAMNGVKIDQALFPMGAATLVANEAEITSVEMPATLTLRWFVPGAGKAGVATLVRVK